MKYFLFISLVFTNLAGFAQEDPAALAKKLTGRESTELGKVKAIFGWITENISYKTRSSSKKAVIGSTSFKNFYSDDEEGPLKSVNERVSLNVLRKKEAVCDGYARLFTTLCDFSGIRSEIIVGYARGGGNAKQRFTVNHNWNAVQIEGKWYLLDVTWASGYLSIAGDEFIRRYDPHYFLTPPEIFFRDHYPDDPRWTLLEDNNVPDEFKRSPFRQKCFTKYGISSFYPSTGIIETFVGDTIRLKLETRADETSRNICPDLLVDSTLFSHSPAWIFLKPDPATATNGFNEYQYTFSVTSPDIKWLYLLYNEDMVLRYKVNVKN